MGAERDQHEPLHRPDGDEPANWDDARADRILAGALLRGRRLVVERRARRRRTIAGAFAGLVAIAALYGMAFRSPGRAGSFDVAAIAPSVAMNAATNAAADLVLADGSRVRPGREGVVRLTEQGEARVVVEHGLGLARYEVTPNPARAFEVRADTVTVRVRGTRFEVERTPAWVDVRLEQGRVEVDDGTRVAVLVDGERLRISLGQATAPGAASFDPAVVSPGSSASPASGSGGARVAPVPSLSGSPEATSPDETPESLLTRATRARGAGQLAEAAETLHLLINKYPRDARIGSALFLLGRVETSRGRPSAAAQAFAQCQRSGPRGTLREDALAEEALAWRAAGDLSKARAAAERYRTSYPRGLQLGRLAPLLE